MPTILDFTVRPELTGNHTQVSYNVSVLIDDPSHTCLTALTLVQTVTSTQNWSVDQKTNYNNNYLHILLNHPPLAHYNPHLHPRHQNTQNRRLRNGRTLVAA